MGVGWNTWVVAFCRGHLSRRSRLRKLSPPSRPKTSSIVVALLMPPPHQAGRDSLALCVVPYTTRCFERQFGTRKSSRSRLSPAACYLHAWYTEIKSIPIPQTKIKLIWLRTQKPSPTLNRTIVGPYIKRSQLRSTPKPSHFRHTKPSHIRSLHRNQNNFDPPRWHQVNFDLRHWS